MSEWGIDWEDMAKEAVDTSNKCPDAEWVFDACDMSFLISKLLQK